MNCFKGVLAPFKIDNELATWNLIKETAQQDLDKFPNSLQDDIDLLAKDDEDHNLTFNKRNCIIYRKGEKELLHYIILSAQKVDELSKLTQEQAKQAINSWQGHDKRCEPYFNNVFLKLLPSLLS